MTTSTSTTKATLGSGCLGVSLLNSLRNSSWLPLYDDDTIRRILDEISQLFGQVDTSIKAQGDLKDPEIVCGVMVHYYSLLRNKRILCAYHRYRMDALEDIRWELGSSLTQYYKKKLNNSECLYFEEYSKLLSNYMNDIDINITSLLQPPKGLTTEVAVIQNIGQIATQYGTYDLNKNIRQSVNTNDVEEMIRRGQVIPTNI